MFRSLTISSQTQKHVRIWLFCVAALIAAMVLVGGATRLTESGLSITEWKPISGALPPLNAADWQVEFQKYQATTEYKMTNRGMSLAEFKNIYWWEWAHRLLGRIIGLAFALPFLLFALSRRLPKPLLLKLGGILLLGGLQGAVGWWMVASGLTGRIDVAPYRLAVHLTLALAIFALVLKVATNLDGEKPAWPLRIKSFVALLFVQIVFGGLVAGARAGYVYNSWPDMNGQIVPDGLLFLDPWWRNIFENGTMVQFVHRCTAYLLVIFAVVMVFAERSRGNAILLGLLLAQMTLGISTLLSGMNMALALAHQAGIVVILGYVVTHGHKFAPVTPRAMPGRGHL